MLEEKYNQINEAGKNQLKNYGIIGAEFDLLKDTRRSLDINYELPDSCKESISEKILHHLNNAFEEIGTSQVIFPKEWLHMTLFTPLSASLNKPGNFFLNSNRLSGNLESYQNVFRTAASSAKPFEITLNRLIVAPGTKERPGCIFLAGFPADNEVRKTREKILQLIENKNLETSQDEIPDIYHVTLARWQNDVSVDKASKIIELVEKIDGKQIWNGIIDTMIFASGGYIMTKEKTVVFETIRLK